MSTFTPNFDGHYRRVLFDSRDNVTVVQSARLHGSLATTFQSNERNVNYILRSSPSDKVIDGKTYTQQGVKFEGHWINGSPMVSRIIKEKLEKIPKDILAFLLGEGNGLLPAGYGWDGIHTNFELTRIGKIKQLIIGDSDFKNITQEVIDVITESIMGGKPEHLMMDWKNSRPFTNHIYPQPLNQDSKLFVFAQNDEVSVRIDIDANADYFEIPQIYNRCVVVVTKFISSTDYPNHGASIELYERKVT